MNRKIRTGNSNHFPRLLCIVWLAVMFLTFCTGCTSTLTAEQMAQIEREIGSLREENESLKEKLNAIKDNSSDLRLEVATLKNINNGLRQELKALTEKNSELQQQIGTLEGSGGDLQEKLDKLTAENQDLLQAIDLLKSDNEELQKEIVWLKEQMEKLQETNKPDDPVEKIRIFIDQGHNPTGKHNSGASGNGLHEEDITYKVGCLLAELLEKDGRFEVCLSRPTQDTVLGKNNEDSLLARAKAAEDFKADYFISIHTNSYTSASANGIEVYTMKKGSTAYQFGSSLLAGLLDATKLSSRGMKQDPGLVVLKETTMPAVLVEIGFITNVKEAQMMSRQPELFAQGMYNGILSYFALQ